VCTPDDAFPMLQWERGLDLLVIGNSVLRKSKTRIWKLKIVYKDKFELDIEALGFAAHHLLERVANCSRLDGPGVGGAANEMSGSTTTACGTSRKLSAIIRRPDPRLDPTRLILLSQKSRG